MEQPPEHIPVLLAQVVSGLRVRAGGRYIDATAGAGGHAAGILTASSPDGRLLALDADPEAIEYSQRVLAPYGDRVDYAVSNFRSLRQCAMDRGFCQADGVLMDLGLSSRQLADPARGFAFSLEGPLDMRMDPRSGPSAADLVNSLPEARLAELLWRLGEERHSRRIAREIVRSRPLVTTGQLASLIRRTVGHPEKNDPSTRTFQALRIAVNDELSVLEEALPQACSLLAPGGAVAVISFHSLEDRIVKSFFRRESVDCVCPPDLPVCACKHKATMRIVTSRPLRPADEEVAANPRSRSARLRIAERLETSAAEQGNR